jgi:hypothetical protein
MIPAAFARKLLALMKFINAACQVLKGKRYRLSKSEAFWKITKHKQGVDAFRAIQ